MGPDAPLLPDLRRPVALPGPRMRIAARTLRLALTAAHACVQRGGRERFAEEPSPSAVERIPYATDDGWQCSLFRCPPPPGAPGEPVLLAHALGWNRLTFDFAAGDGLVHLLHAAGFDVFLWEHRADGSAFAPRRPTACDADAIASQDLPAALDAVRARTGAARVGWVGHGLGGQLLYLHLALDPEAPLFAAACLGAAVRFARPASSARTAGLVAGLLPARLGLPTRQVLRLLSPGAGGAGWAVPALDCRGLEGPRLRGLLNHGADDLRGGLVRQVARWIEQGVLGDAQGRVDCLEALRGHPLPLLVLAADEDTICRPAAALAVLEALGAGERRSAVVRGPCGHLDLVQGEVCRRVTGPAVVDWLARHRQRAW